MPLLLQRMQHCTIQLWSGKQFRRVGYVRISKLDGKSECGSQDQPEELYNITIIISRVLPDVIASFVPKRIMHAGG